MSRILEPLFVFAVSNFPKHYFFIGETLNSIPFHHDLITWAKRFSSSFCRGFDLTSTGAIVTIYSSEEPSIKVAAPLNMDVTNNNTK